MVRQGFDVLSYAEPVDVWLDYTTPEEFKEDEAKSRTYVLSRGKGIVPHASPGAIYSFEHDPETVSTIYSTSAKYIGRLEDEAVVARWQAANRASEALMQARKAEESDNDKRYDWEALDPFREAYSRCFSAQRPILLAQIVRYITAQRGR